MATLVHVEREVWPHAKSSAVTFSIDDVHPGTRQDYYEAGGDLEEGVLGRLAQLLNRIPELKTTLFVTPDWREICPYPTRRVAKIPLVRRYLYQTGIRPRGEMALDRHVAFSKYLQSLNHVEIAMHGLHHVQRGPNVPVEYEAKGRWSSLRSIERGLEIFEKAGFDRIRGFGPPAWCAPDALLFALERSGFRYFSASRDLDSTVNLNAWNAGSGRGDVCAFRPSRVTGHELLHIPINFQATSSFDRAYQILEQGGLLSIKAHAIEDAFGHIALDALNLNYVERLSDLFSRLRERFGESIWFATFGEIQQEWDLARSPT